jgi:hypothetical protein
LYGIKREKSPKKIFKKKEKRNGIKCYLGPKKVEIDISGLLGSCLNVLSSKKTRDETVSNWKTTKTSFGLKVLIRPVFLNDIFF